MANYSGSNRPQAIISWARKRLGHGVHYLPTEGQLDEFSRTYNGTAIGYFPSVNVDYIDTFRMVDRSLNILDFAYSSEPEVGAKLGLETDSILISVHGESHIISKDLDNLPELLKACKLLTYPRLILLDRFWVQDLLLSQFPVLFVYSQTTSEPVFDHRTLEAVRHSGFLLAMVDCNSNDISIRKLSEFLGAGSCSSVWIVEEPRNPDTVKHYLETEDISNEKILEFVSQYSQRQLAPFVKSDTPEPSSPYEARVIVGSEWSTLVSSDSPKLVLFYTPWCRYCAPAIDAIDQVASQRLMLVAKMDKSRNDSPGLPVDSYPSIFLIFPKSVSGHKRYRGPLTADSVTVWAETLLRDEL